ncbi:MAG: hypothetical protein RR617_06245 [Anaerovoracaceae bacterium]
MKYLFKISSVVVMNVVKRYISFAIGGFIALLMILEYPLLISKVEFTGDLLGIASTLYILFLPIACSVVVFSYLHKNNSAMMIHAMPVSAERVFNSYFVGGLILLILPIIAITPILMLQGGVKFVGLWCIESIVSCLMVYAITVLAAVVSGNMLMHFFMACFLNGLSAGIMFYVYLFSQRFLNGFTVKSDLVSATAKMSPVTNKIINAGGGFIGYKMLAIYFVLAVGLIIISSLLYRKIKLEKVGDSIVFEFVKPIIVFFVGVMGMTSVSFIFAQDYYAGNDEEITSFYIALIVGAICFFAIGTMMVNKTLKIFTSKTAKQFIVFAIISGLFVSTFVFDLTGFEKRVPKVSEVNSINCGEFIGGLGETAQRYNPIHYNGNSQLTSKENIENMRIYHQKAMNISKNSDNQFIGMNAILKYNLLNEKVFVREYKIYGVGFKKSPELKEIFESKEFKEKYGPKNIKNISHLNCVVLDNQEIENRVHLIKSNQIKGILEAQDKDFKNRTYEEHLADSVGSVSYTINDTKSNTRRNDVYNNIKIAIKLSDKNTIKYLDKLGVSIDELKNSQMEINFMEVTEIKDGKIKKIKITDKNKMKAINELRYTDKFIVKEYSNIFEQTYEFGGNINRYEINIQRGDTREMKSEKIMLLDIR